MTILETRRLTLHKFQHSDALFLLDVMNQPGYHRYIGDRGLRTIEDAKLYIEDKFRSAYKKHGFGFWLIRLKEARSPIGFAGLVVRAELDEPDVGYAIHEDMAGNGYAEEATRGVLEYAACHLAFPIISAITHPDNDASINVLLKCGFLFDKRAPVFEDGEELNIYKLALQSGNEH